MHAGNSDQSRQQYGRPMSEHMTFIERVLAARG
jgi:hypothetical protein